MLVRFFRFIGTLLHGPVALCAGLFTFLVLLLLVLNRLIFVDANGHELYPGTMNIRQRGPITNELIRLTRDEKWTTNPEKRARVFELHEMLGQPGLADHPQPTHISIPYRIKAK